jgi:hypothetical protein
MTAEGWHDQVGSVAEEASRLLESLRRTGQDEGDGSDGAHEPAPGAPGAAAGAAPGDDDSRSHGNSHGTPGGFSCDDPVCQWCPVCRASAFVRQLSPETLSGLAEFAGFAATVLGDLAAARARQEQPRGDHDD